MAEQILLDPSEVSASGRTTLDITPWIAQGGIDYGDAQINAIMADRDRGSFPVDFTVPNRDISVPLVFSKTTGGTTVAQARANIQAKIALFQKEGGWIKRITTNGGTVYADVVDAATHGFASYAGWEATNSADVDPTISLTTLPDFYQDEITLSDHVETTAAEINFTETGILGDYPARVRVVVDDDQAQDQRGLVWAFRSRYYDSASTAALKYEAEALGTLDTAAKAALSGASGGTVVTHGTLSTNWTPVLSTNIAGTQYMTQKGTYRLYGRVYSTSGTTVQARAVWDVGDLVNPVENDAWRLPGASNFYTHDFGELRLDAPPVGTYRWQGQIQARGDVGGENFSVDKLWLVPVDEGMGVLTAPLTAAQGLATYSARSEFATESGAITGDSLAVGGTWTGAGDADDFSVAAGVATRTATSDTVGLTNGRKITASTPTLTSVAAQVDLKISAFPAGTDTVYAGVILRYVDASNFVALVASLGGSSASAARGFFYYEVTAGVASSPAGHSVAGQVFTADTWYTLRALALTGGEYVLWFGPQGGALPPVLRGSRTGLATGGTFASGKVGLIDHNISATASTRTYDNYSAWIPTNDAVTFASRSTQLTTDGHFRLDSGGTAYGPVSIQAGDLPRLPVAGLEGRTTEILLKNSRGDFDQFPDSHTSTDSGDDLSARISYRPCWLNTGTM